MDACWAWFALAVVGLIALFLIEEVYRRAEMKWFATKEPWALKLIDREMMEEFRRKERCEWCKRPVARCEPHHVLGRGIGGGRRIDHPFNLVALCLECHRSHHDGNPPLKCDLLAIVAAREGVLQDEIEEEINRIRRL